MSTSEIRSARRVTGALREALVDAGFSPKPEPAPAHTYSPPKGFAAPGEVRAELVAAGAIVEGGAALTACPRHEHGVLELGDAGHIAAARELFAKNSRTWVERAIQRTDLLCAELVREASQTAA